MVSRNSSVKRKGKTESEDTWIVATDLQRLDPDLYKQYIAAESSEPNFRGTGGIDGVRKPV